MSYEENLKEKKLAILSLLEKYIKLGDSLRISALKEELDKINIELESINSKTK